MLARLRAWNDIIYRDESLIKIGKNNHYWKFHYKDKPALGFRDFYLKYWKGDRMVTIKPKRDRKKNIIPGKFEVYGKRGNYVFTAYEFWFEWLGPKSKYELRPEWALKPKASDIARKRALPNLPWDELFEI